MLEHNTMSDCILNTNQLHMEYKNWRLYIHIFYNILQKNLYIVVLLQVP